MGTELQYDGGFTAESWEYATAFALSLGTLPTSVTSVVRLLLSDFQKNPLSLSEGGQFFLARFLKSESFKASYYYALRCLRPEMIPPANEPLSKERFFEAFTGEEHALLLSLIFFHRQARKFCDEALFENATAMLQKNINLGAKIGKTLPSIGLCTGMLCSGFQLLALFPILRHDPEGFLRYTRHIRANSSLLDTSFEYERWQCNSVQIGIMVLQRAGFGADRLSRLLKATATKSPVLPSDSFERACRAAQIWHRCVVGKLSNPTIPLPPQFYIGPKELEAVLDYAENGTGDKSESWLSRRKSEITPETAPQLFIEKPETEIILDAPILDRAGLAPVEGESPDDASLDPLSDDLVQDLLSAEAD